MRRLLAAAVLLAAVTPAAAQAEDYKKLCFYGAVQGLPPLPTVCIPLLVDPEDLPPVP